MEMKPKGQNKIATQNNISIEQYLEKVARFADSEYGNLIRNQFKDIKGASELAMLAAPTAGELGQLKKAVAIMTPAEKQNAHILTDEQVRKIADDAKIDALRLLSEHVGQETMLQQVSPRDAESFVASRLAEGLAVGSVNKDIRTLKGIFNLAIEPRGYLAEGDEGNPYVFISTRCWKHILRRRSEGTWQSDYEIVNNLTRSIDVICRRAHVEYFTPHDLRRSCITNWAMSLPIQTLQYLAGHSDIGTTRKYYLSVQKSDMTTARGIQSELLAKLTNF